MRLSGFAVYFFRGRFRIFSYNAVNSLRSIPFSGITSERGWDGSAEDALEIVDHLAAYHAENVCIDRGEFGPTGWEPEFDEPV